MNIKRLLEGELGTRRRLEAAQQIKIENQLTTSLGYPAWTIGLAVPVGALDQLMVMYRLQPEEPGLLVVQIDGLSLPVLERGLAEGRMPFLRRVLQRERAVLHPMSVGLPTSTPAFQMAAMYGVGIVAAPCVGPFVVALLAILAQRGDVSFGFASMFMLSLGLGFPYLFLAAFSSALPSRATAARSCAKTAPVSA